MDSRSRSTESAKDEDSVGKGDRDAKHGKWEKGSSSALDVWPRDFIRLGDFGDRLAGWQVFPLAARRAGAARLEQ
jgi:hypothetical protein